MAGVPIPPLQFSGGASRSDAYGGTASSGGMFDNAGFVVNYAPSVGVGGALPAWAIAAAVIVGAVWIFRKH
jgi:hypothetical protein